MRTQALLLALLLRSLGQIRARECNTQIGQFTAEQVKQLGRQFVAPIVEDQFLDTASRAFFLTAQYDVRVRKQGLCCQLLSLVEQDSKL